MAEPQDPQDPPVPLPPGAKLVSGDPSQIKLPPGAKLVSAGAPAPQSASLPAPQPSLFQSVTQGGLNFLKGAAKGAAHTVSDIDSGVSKIPGIGTWMTTPLVGDKTSPQAISDLKKAAVPHGTAQNLGYGGEQVGEFFLPGVGEEAAAAKLLKLPGVAEKAAELAPKVAELAPRLTKALPKLGQVAGGALNAGLVNKAQGGDFTTGAEMGGASEGLALGAKALAPTLAETALGTRLQDRAFGRTPGQAILSETKGINPRTVAESAQRKVGDLTDELEANAQNSKVPFNLEPTQDALNKLRYEKMLQNSPLVKDINKIQSQLSTDSLTGQPFPNLINARRGLDLKRGVGDLIKTWSPEKQGPITPIKNSIYHTLDQELDRTVPDSEGINQRISSLLPVADRAEAKDLGANILQRSAHRLAAHTGAAVVGAGAGGTYGYEKGGVPGAVLGAGAGILGQEALMSPRLWMAAARSSNAAPKLAPVIPGVTLQFARPDQEEYELPGVDASSR